MAWYHTTGQDQDIVLYTDVRLARNLRAYPFTHRLDAAGAREIIDSVGAVLEENGFCKRDFADISRAEAYSLVERQYASLSFVKKSLPHALYLNEPCSMSAMLCEEDHINLQCIPAGRALCEAYASVSRVERFLDERFDMAFTAGEGYLSPFPGVADGGMQISALLCLPSMVEAGQMGRWIESLSGAGVCLRSIRDEKGSEVGSLFHLNYRPSVSQSETEALAFVEEILVAMIAEEHSALHTALPIAAEQRMDRIMRAVGTLRYARLIHTSELLNLLADVRLGIRIGVVTGVNMETLTSLMMESLPAGLSMTAAYGVVDPASPLSDAAARASFIKERITSGACVLDITA